MSDTDRPKLGRNVFALSAVSFLTDVSSEMIYPLLPVFLTTVLGANASFIGAIEGCGGDDGGAAQAGERLVVGPRAEAQAARRSGATRIASVDATARRDRDERGAGARASASRTASARGSAMRRATH